ncbi:MAG: radical SAM protein [Planctomycetes bacterium]|nr:radical SAM protein [Planctomycetota bacterium]
MADAPPPAGPVDLLGLTAGQLAEAAALALPSGAGLAPKVFTAAHRHGRFAPEELPIPPANAAAWRRAFTLGLLTVVRTVEEDSEAGLTAKAVLRTADGFEAECVLIPMRTRDGATDHTLCLSSQVGCRMGCAFCETARMGLVRQLTAGEIVAQVVTVGQALGWRPRNLVFMGMGEALDNAANLFQAIRVLTDQRGLQYSFERLTVCTAGHAAGIAALAAQGWKRLNLSLSLNAASDTVRDRLMPVNRRTPLAELQRVLAAYPQRRNFILGVNWCLMPGINDAREDAAQIAAFCRPLGRVLVNLIPYNPGSAPLTRAPEEDEVVRFVAWLREEGLAVRRRITKGRSIMAACGQLGNPALRRRRASDPPA